MPMTLGMTCRHWLAGLALVAGLGLAGCQVQPLYGTLSSGGTARDETRAIDIEPAKSRVEQVLRNELIFGFTGGGYAAEPRYRLRIVLSQQDSAVGVEKLSDVPAAYFLLLRASFVLSRVSDGETILTGTSFANASYDFSSQRFANVRALRDAENRAAKVIAGDIRTRILAHFASKG